MCTPVHHSLPHFSHSSVAVFCLCWPRLEAYVIHQEHHDCNNLVPVDEQVATTSLKVAEHASVVHNLVITGQHRKTITRQAHYKIMTLQCKYINYTTIIATTTITMVIAMATTMTLQNGHFCHGSDSKV